MNEIELILNNRPIIAAYEDDEHDVLTPNHLIFGRRIESSNDFSGISVNTNTNNSKLVKRKKMLDTIISHFWERWRKEYVASLRENQRIPKQRHSNKVEIDDVVVIYEDKQPRHLWKLGKIVNIIPGRDGRIRGAVVKVGKSGAVIRRPVNRLYPLVKAKLPVNKSVEAGNVK